MKKTNLSTLLQRKRITLRQFMQDLEISNLQALEFYCQKNNMFIDSSIEQMLINTQTKCNSIQLEKCKRKKRKQDYNNCQ